MQRGLAIWCARKVRHWRKVMDGWEAGLFPLRMQLDTYEQKRYYRGNFMQLYGYRL